MAKIKKQFVCNDCGTIHPQWSGQCLDCQAWNSLEEVILDPNPVVNTFLPNFPIQGVQKLSQISQENHQRISTGLAELDRTLGGGLVVGSVVLIGGDPGIGKSTLILQSLASINQNQTTLYISGEESQAQISNRANRLGIKEDILLLSESNLERIIKITQEIQPKVLVIDSIQTMMSPASQSSAGSVSQVRDCASQLTQYAKRTNTTLLMIGHVTKGGALAGPRVLEHMVDSVLYFEGDAGGRYRVIRAVKNRFGAVNEISVFAMSEKGLLEINNPSAIFLSNNTKPAPGSMVMVTREATRPLLVELQALVNQNSGASPSRVCVGVDQNRLSLLLAVLHKHGDFATYDQDVFINIVGGLKITETASDLTLLLAIVSSISNKIIPKEWIAFGEVGLTGEIRPVYNGSERLSEAQKHGFKLAIIPKANAPQKPIKDMKIIAVEHLPEALNFFRGNT